MPRMPLAPLLLALLVALAPPLSAAEEAVTLPASPVPALDGDEVLLFAERVERSGADNVIVAAGAVVIRHRELRLAADRVVYNEKTKDAVADGNVVFDNGPDRLQGTHLELNLETRVGFLDHAQGFVQTYYFTGERVEKLGLDRYFIHGGAFTTCAGVLPDWSFHTTSTEVTVDEYLYAWNPSLRVKRLPVFYFPYAVFPIKRERATGLLVPNVRHNNIDGLVLGDSFFWAPSATFDATIGLDYLQRTGWGANGELRYLLAPRTQGILEAHYLRNTGSAAERWSLSTRNSHELPYGVHAEGEAFFQSDREFIATYGDTIEQRSSERTTSSIFLNRSWSAWDFALSARREESLLTAGRTTLTRFPELTVDRTSTRIFDTDLFVKVSASGARLEREDSGTDLATTRLHLSPELTWPLSFGGIGRIIPTAGYSQTFYSADDEGHERARGLPYYRLSLEGPRVYRVWELDGGGPIEKIKHLIEPRVGYVYTPQVGQEHIPQFDSIDRIPEANRLEYSITNTVYAKTRTGGALGVPGAVAGGALGATAGVGETGETGATGETGEGALAPVTPGPAARYTTQELAWIKLSQSYTLAGALDQDAGQPFSPVEWEARTRYGPDLEIWWKGNFGVYGKAVGYQNVAITWKPFETATLRGEWRTARDSQQDFLDLETALTLGRFGINGRSRYNLAEETFVENRASLKYTSQCWDVTVSYVRWPNKYEYSLLLSLKGIGTILRF